MTSNADDFEVFQDLVLRGGGVGHLSIRGALLNSLAPPWRHAEAKEEALSANRGSKGQLLAFERVATDDGLESATLILWSQDGDYVVSQIVPLKVKASSLSHRQHNEILQDFELQIAAPAAVQAGFIVERTTPRESPDDWVSPKTAKALRDFSRAANKSKGSSHPLDQERWLNFLITAHSDKDSKLDTLKLARWLFEAENWNDDKASELVIEYEFGLNLLRAYHSRRPAGSVP